nr:DUF2716 domain-containing protein [Streptomyces venezuelae]
MELSDAEDRRVWDRFYEKFSFQPSMSPSVQVAGHQRARCVSHMESGDASRRT